ncbi:hypothetical protein ACFQZZ_16540 [Nocardia sp. GCM10030253]|uniref:hypothetical protein n=1 Tax=Nocardia sp. GCM10030253 TaxID=3273404 RepID=UPI0036311DF3
MRDDITPPTADFDIVPVAIDRYRHHPTIEAEAEAESVAETAGEYLDCSVWSSEPAVEHSETVVKQRLNAWAERDDRSAVLIWLSHGAANPHGAWLATHETPPVITRSGVTPDAIADIVNKQADRRRRHRGVWVVVVVEACGAATFARLLTSRLLSGLTLPVPFAVVGVGGDRSAGNLGEFRRLLREALEGTYTDNDGPQIRAHELMSNLHSRIGHSGPDTFIHYEMHAAAPLRRRVVLSSTVTAPLDIYRELRSFLADLPEEEVQHFLSKAQGAEQGELAWYFVGRHQERRRIVTWLRSAMSGMLVITGRPGAGKSALLANILLHTDETVRELLIQNGYLPVTAESELPPGPFDAVIQLTGFTAATLVTRLATTLGLPVPAGGGWPGTDADLLLDALRGRAHRVTVLADALDEAQEPLAIAGLLRRIAALPGGRVVVGTRASTDEDPDEPDAGRRNLLDALDCGADTEFVPVDRDPDAIETYVRRRLDAASAAGRLDLSDTTISEVAGLIAGREHQFLFARLAIHELLARPTILEPARRGELAELLGGDHRSLFAVAVDRLVALSRAYDPLLRALALAHGRGVPRQGRIWIIIANSLTTPAGDLTESDVDGLRQHGAPYIMVDAEDGQSVYRLAHRTFKEHFRSRHGLSGHG